MRETESIAHERKRISAGNSKTPTKAWSDFGADAIAATNSQIFLLSDIQVLL